LPERLLSRVPDLRQENVITLVFLGLFSVLGTQLQRMPFRRARIHSYGINLVLLKALRQTLRKAFHKGTGCTRICHRGDTHLCSNFWLRWKVLSDRCGGNHEKEEIAKDC